ncbi:MAG: helix-hairpin-helix domain-containing protein [Gammaproteobacteria bacterium]|nr:helix-hairpin-helix domain-containing protein [Gammaproteobacteria bacterium]
MATIYSTVLVTAPVAFMVGWLLAKVMFRHLSIVRPAVAPRPADTSPVDAAGRDRNPVVPPHRELSQLRQALAQRTAELDALRNELALLRAGVAEGEQRVAELRQRLADQTQPPEQSTAAVSRNETEFRALLRAQQSRLVKRDARIAELAVELEAAAARTARLADILRRWRERKRPLTRQYRQQRLIISELREELRQRDAYARAPAASGRQAATPAPQIANSDLQSLHGVGPALQQRLHDKGIYNLSQFAEMSPAELSKLHGELGLGRRRAAKYDWITQSRENLGLPRRAATPASPLTVASA